MTHNENKNISEDICYMAFKDCVTGEEYKGYLTRGENQDGNIMVLTILDNDGEGAKTSLDQADSEAHNVLL